MLLLFERVFGLVIERSREKMLDLLVEETISLPHVVYTQICGCITPARTVPYDGYLHSQRALHQHRWASAGFRIGKSTTVGGWEPGVGLGTIPLSVAENQEMRG